MNLQRIRNPKSTDFLDFLTSVNKFNYLFPSELPRIEGKTNLSRSWISGPGSRRPVVRIPCHSQCVCWVGISGICLLHGWTEKRDWSCYCRYLINQYLAYAHLDISLSQQLKYFTPGLYIFNLFSNSPIFIIKNPSKSIIVTFSGGEGGKRIYTPLLQPLYDSKCGFIEIHPAAWVEWIQNIFLLACIALKHINDAQTTYQ